MQGDFNFREESGISPNDAALSTGFDDICFGRVFTIFINGMMGQCLAAEHILHVSRISSETCMYNFFNPFVFLCLLVPVSRRDSSHPTLLQLPITIIAKMQLSFFFTVHNRLGQFPAFYTERDHGASKKAVNPWPEWIHLLLWCTMIQTVLGSLIPIRITPTERTLRLGVPTRKCWSC